MKLAIIPRLQTSKFFTKNSFFNHPKSKNNFFYFLKRVKKILNFLTFLSKIRVYLYISIPNTYTFAIYFQKKDGHDRLLN